MRQEEYNLDKSSYELFIGIKHGRQSLVNQKAIAVIRYMAAIIISMLFHFVRGAEVGYVTLDHCESTSGWMGPHGFILDTENMKEGSGCVSSSGDELVSFSKTYSPRNTYLSEDDGYLKFWLYISDVSRYDHTGQIEITSSGSFDVDEYSWNMNNIYLKDGWNYLVLPFAEASKNGSPDLSAINFFRIYSFFTDSVTIKLDFIIFHDDKTIPLPGVQIDACDQTTAWYGHNTIYRDIVNRMQGYGSLFSYGNGTDRFTKVFSPVDANVSFDKGYLNFWLFVSDINTFNEIGQVEITSSGGPDVDEYNWFVSCLSLKNGWNHVYLKLAHAHKNGNPDLNAINFFRFYNQMNDTVLVGIDDIRFTENSPPKPQIINPNTLHNKVLFGYQGWFGAPGDSSLRNQWVHWFRNNIPDADNASFDNWPDLSEYDEDELFETELEYSGVEPAKLYSAYRYKTVERHFKWMYDHQLDGVFLQRFIAPTQWEGGLDFIDKVTENVMKSSNKYERVWAIEFCIQENEDYWVEVIKNDWMHLVDDLNVTLDPYYIKHKGRPLVGIYGIGFDMYSYATPEEAQELIDWFHSEAPEKYRATIMVGVPESWRSDAEYIDFYSTVDVIKPWAVGRYGNEATADNFLNQYIAPDKIYCDAHQIDYLPVIWPGSSRFNQLRSGEYLKNRFPREGGNFYWRQSYNVNRAEVNMIFIAMFDEVDEGTAMYKIEPHHENVPTDGYWLTLDADGYELPSDWYLRLASETGRTLRNEIVNDPILPEIPNLLSVDSLNYISSVVPEITLPDELHGCEGNTLEVIPIVRNTSWLSWSDGTTDTINYIYCDNSRSIWLTGGNNCGTSSDTMDLTVHTNPVIDLGPADTLYGNESITLTAPGSYIVYLWNNTRGDSIFIADNTTLNPGLNEINLTVFDHHNCSGSDVVYIYLFENPGINNKFDKYRSIIVFPNPCQEQIHLIFKGYDRAEKHIILYDAHGREVLSEKTGNERMVTLKIHHLPPGSYFLHINTGDYQDVFSMVKN